VTFGAQMDVREAVVAAGRSTLSLELTMAELTTVWNPANGFDHVCFTIYFDVPGADGLTLLPRIHAEAPAGFTWDYTHFAFGWGNSLHATEGASETEWGMPLAGAPDIEVDGGARRIVFRYDRRALGLASWEGVKVYVTTWDFDGIDARYRPMSPEGGQWLFGGGAADDPFILDDVGPIEIPPATP
jgi:hypothetical protein